MPHKFMNYAGAKTRHLDAILPLLGDMRNKTLVEPFGGSLVVSMNAVSTRTICADYNPHLVNAWNACRDTPWQKLRRTLDGIRDEFGDVRTDKDAYYSVREDYNRRLFNGAGDYDAMPDDVRVMSGLTLLLLINSCINSFARFGPNGFNQSFGRRNAFETVISMDAWEHSRSRLYGAVTLCGDYRQTCAAYYDDADCVWFVDPPYFERPAHSYSSEFEDIETFLSWVRGIRGRVVYTDTMHGGLDWDHVELRRIRNSAPSVTDRDNADNMVEVAYFRDAIAEGKS